MYVDYFNIIFFLNIMRRTFYYHSFLFIQLNNFHSNIILTIATHFLTQKSDLEYVLMTVRIYI